MNKSVLNTGTHSGNVRRSLESKSLEQTLLESLDVLVLLEVLRGHAEASAHHHHQQDAPTMHHCGIVGGTPALRAQGGRASAAASGERANAPPHAASPLYRLAAPRCQQVPAPPPPATPSFPPALARGARSR